VGPEKCDQIAELVATFEFQSVSGLWDRRNLPARIARMMELRFQSVSGLWDRRNATTRAAWTT